jgi:hypothetical protein
MSVYYTLCFLAALAIFIAFANQYVVNRVRQVGAKDDNIPES